MTQPIDNPIEVRKGEELDEHKLLVYLKSNLTDFPDHVQIKQFPSGFSNLTYLIRSEKTEYVLRKPPLGANIKSAHDMSREFKVLSLLAPVYKKIPKPILFCEDVTILGAPFYLMERVKGIILRNRIPQGMKLTSDHFKKLSNQTIENLVDLHNLELERSNLISLGKPQGYVKRQVEGWIKRYFKAETDEISSMNMVSEWMKSNLPTIENDSLYS